MTDSRQQTHHHRGVRRQIPDWERKFQCPHPNCGKRFTRKFSMTEHIKTHTGDKPHECTVPGCGKKFTTAGNLARHRKIHDGVKDERGGDESPSSSTSSSSSHRLGPRTIHETYARPNNPTTIHHAHTTEFLSTNNANTTTFSGPPSAKLLSRRRFSVPTTHQDFHTQYKAPAHLLQNNNHPELLFPDPEMMHRQKIDSIRQFETQGTADPYFNSYAPQISQPTPWLHPQQQQQHTMPYMGMKQTRSQSLTHQQLSSHLQVMQAAMNNGGYNKFFDGNNSSQPSTDVETLLREDEEDNNQSQHQIMKSEESLHPSNPQWPETDYSKMMKPATELLPTTPLDFSTNYSMVDSIIDENEIIDILFDDRSDFEQNLEPTQTMFQQQNGYVHNQVGLFDDWKAQDTNVSSCQPQITG